MTDRVSMQHQATEQDVQRQVEAFARAILETPEYRAFKQAADALRNDQAAWDLFQQYEKTKAALFDQIGLDAASFNEVRALDARIRSNATLTAYHGAERALATMLNQTNDRISEKIGQQFACGHRGGCRCHQHGGHHHHHHHGGCC